MTRLSDEFRESLEKATARYEWALQSQEGSQARSYLYGRGMQPHVIDAYRLGMVNADIPEHASYRGWISIPYITKLGGVVSLKFRRLDGGEPKYISPYLTRIYNALAFDKAEELGYIAITEGEFDAIILDGLCGIPAVAIPGVETWKAHPEWPELFRGFSRVLVFKDQDEDREQSDGKVRNPGRELADQITRALDTAHVVDLPAKDVNETYLEFGADRIREVAGL
jgi:DNA primase